MPYLMVEEQERQKHGRDGRSAREVGVSSTPPLDFEG